jgi:predicted TIM-barrel fold metal-dependent hydrolase
MTIDVWMQHPTLRFLNTDMLASLRRWVGTELPSEEIPIAATVAAMDAGGVDFGLLSAWHGPREGALISNEEVAGWIAAHPDRFAGLAGVNLDKPMEAVRELRRCVTELGFKGLRVVPWLWEAPPTDRRYYPLFAAAYTSKRIPPELVRYMQTGSGRHKVLYGSNYPMILPAHALADLDGLGLDDEVRALYLQGNARRVFKLA